MKPFNSGQKSSGGGGLKLSSLLLNIAHPVGSIIQTTKTQAQFDPNTMLGGTWELLQGVFLFGADATHALGGTGGSPNATLVSHNHTVSASGSISGTAAYVSLTGSLWNMARQTVGQNLSASGICSVRKANEAQGYGSSSSNTGIDGFSINASHSHSVSGSASVSGSTSNAGGAAKEANMPPYKSVNIWERTA